MESSLTAENTGSIYAGKIACKHSGLMIVFDDHYKSYLNAADCLMLSVDDWCGQDISCRTTAPNKSIIQISVIRGLFIKMRPLWGLSDSSLCRHNVTL